MHLYKPPLPKDDKALLTRHIIGPRLKLKGASQSWSLLIIDTICKLAISALLPWLQFYLRL